MRRGRHPGRLPDSDIVEKENGGDNPRERESRRCRTDKEEAEFIYEYQFEMFLNTQACTVSRPAEEPAAHGLG